MRVVSADPEFTWSGTLGIIGLFTVAGAAQGVALAVRRRRWPRWAQTIVRIPVGFTALLLGGGAGIVMLPAMAAGSLAAARRDWPRWIRIALGGIVGLNVVAMLPMLHVDLGWGRTIIGWLLMLPLYAVIIGAISLNLRPLDDGWRMPTRVRVAVLAAVAAFASTIVVLSALGI